MDDNEALEMIDAHLDSETVTPDQADALSTWLRDDPDHADLAFQRIFLHTFLRQRLQYAPLPTESALTTIEEPFTELIVTQPGAIVVADQRRAGRKRLAFGRKTGLTFCVFVCLLTTVAGRGFQTLYSTGAAAAGPAGLWAYDGFDYPPTFPPAPLGDGSKWPTTGGIQGMSGGHGWNEPWHESAPKVAILVADMHANAWRPSDMRKFGPLGYADSRGKILKSTGIQLRTAAGPLSTTVRPLDLTAFPPLVVDQRGVGCDGAVIWLSFLTQSFDGRGLGNFAFVQLGSEAAGFRLGKLASVPSGNWAASGIQDEAELNLRWSDVPSGLAVLLVARITFRPGDEEADVWINPGLESEPTTSSANLHVPLPDFRFDRITISSRYTTDFDELRLGGTFRDVTPIR
jgi:hypothetical protein